MELFGVSSLQHLQALLTPQEGQKEEETLSASAQLGPGSTGPKPTKDTPDTKPTVKRPRQAHRPQLRRILPRLVSSGGLEILNARYKQGRLLGSGGYASVYSGVRKSDGLRVAIKHIPKDKVGYFRLASCGRVYNIPVEVYIMYRAMGGFGRVGQSAAVSLLEWFKLDTRIAIVMERPNPSMDLLSYSIRHYPLPEDTVRDIMKQLVLAVKDLHQKRVFHRDLKPENILIQETKEGIRVRIIDFGCSCRVSTNPYTSYKGTSNFCPPEFFLDQKYRDGPTSVWQLGVIAFELLIGDGSDFDMWEWILGEQSMKTSDASDEGKDFVQVCLEAYPSNRMSLEELEQHVWFLSTAQARP